MKHIVLILMTLVVAFGGIASSVRAVDPDVQALVKVVDCVGSCLDDDRGRNRRRQPAREAEELQTIPPRGTPDQIVTAVNTTATR